MACIVVNKREIAVISVLVFGVELLDINLALLRIRHRMELFDVS